MVSNTVALWSATFAQAVAAQGQRFPRPSHRSPPSMRVRFQTSCLIKVVFMGFITQHSAVNYTAEHHKPLFWRRLATKLSPLVVPQLCPKMEPLADTEQRCQLSVRTELFVSRL